METLESRLQKRIYISLYAIIFLTLLLGLSVLLESCMDTCEYKNEYRYFEPKYTKLEDLRSAVAVESPKPLSAVGKIYIQGALLFISDPGKGIHVIDNQDPQKPVAKNFINVPGNYDLSVMGNILYADSYIDLVAIDISDVSNPREVSRLENVFSDYNTLGFYLDESLGLITEWVEKTEVKVYESDCHANVQPWGGIFYENGVAFARTANVDMSAAIAPGNGSGPGVGGSTARFTINQNHLFALDSGSLRSFDITFTEKPREVGHTFIGWDLETVFPYKANVLIGSQTGMHIVDVSNPASPTKISTYSHVRVCDPVVAENDLAYVTLRSGTMCGGFQNQLEVIDIADLKAPKVLHTYPMVNPHGLGIDGSMLFICDGNAGLKVFDASDVSQISSRLLAAYPTINAHDVIPFGGVLIMIGEDGLYQYDYSDPAKIRLLSKITFVKS
jgi:hypothetical protein